MKNKINGVIFDLDGTIYIGNKLLPGAKSAINWLKNRNIRIAFISNKPIETNKDYAKKLTLLGIQTTPNEVINSTNALISFLRDNYPNAIIFPIGEKPLVDELSLYFPLSENPNEIEIVIASFDRTFNYEKLNIGFQAIRNGAKFFATNADPTCPVPSGEIPDAGAIIGALEGCTKKKVEFIAGKPSKMIINTALNQLNIRPENCIFIGDRLSTDIRMGKESNLISILVLTGVTSIEELKNSVIKPDYIIENLSSLPDLINTEFS